MGTADFKGLQPMDTTTAPLGTMPSGDLLSSSNPTGDLAASDQPGSEPGSVMPSTMASPLDQETEETLPPSSAAPEPPLPPEQSLLPSTKPTEQQARYSDRPSGAVSPPPQKGGSRPGTAPPRQMSLRFR